MVRTLALVLLPFAHIDRRPVARKNVPLRHPRPPRVITIQVLLPHFQWLQTPVSLQNHWYNRIDYIARKLGNGYAW